MRCKFLTSGLFGLLFLFAAVLPVDATPFVNMTFNGLETGKNGSWTFYNNGGTSNGSGGIFNWTMNNNDVTSTGDPFPVVNGGKFITFCIEILETIPGGATVNYESINLADAPNNNGAQGPMGAAKAALIRAWFGNYWQGEVANWTLDEARAFQLGLWEIVYENSGTVGVFSAGGGTFYRTGGSTGGVGLAEFWFQNLDLSKTRHVFALSTPTTNPATAIRQDQVTVPEPGTMLLVASGIAAMGWKRRRFA